MARPIRSGFFRPGREALIIRRLIARHRGSLPRATIVRMWRELLSATLRQQGPSPWPCSRRKRQRRCWDLARDHFGSLMPATAHDQGRTGACAPSSTATPRSACCRCRARKTASPWWPFLVSRTEGQPRVIARLPFGAPATPAARRSRRSPSAAMAQEETGRDCSLFVIEASAEISRQRPRATRWRPVSLAPHRCSSGATATRPRGGCT